MNCPCCAGLNEGDCSDLCDTCCTASLTGTYPHGCKRPKEEA